MAMKELSISKKQADLLYKAQMVLSQADAQVSTIANAILAGFDVDGRVHQVDTDRCLLTVEVPDISPENDETDATQLVLSGS